MADPIRQYTAEEDRQLAQNLRALLIELHRGDWLSREIGHGSLRQIHERLFAGVRSHAGRYRSDILGSDYLVFGPNRSEHRDRVEEALGEAFAKAGTSLASIEANPAALEYEESAIHLAAWIHAEIIRIHPFEDGNGRSSRAMMNHVLVRLGLRPIAVEATKDEYNQVLNAYHGARDLQPLIDLLIRLYENPPEEDAPDENRRRE